MEVSNCGLFFFPNFSAMLFVSVQGTTVRINNEEIDHFKTVLII